MSIDTSILGNLKAALYAVVAFVGLPVDPMLALSVLILIDFVTGVGSAYILEEPVTSNRARIGILSKVVLLLIPVTMALVMKALGASHYLEYANSIIYVLVLSEAYSIIGNIYTIQTKERVKELDAVSALLKSLLTAIQEILKRFTFHK